MQLKRSYTGKKALNRQSLGWKKIGTRDVAEKSECSKPRKHADMRNFHVLVGYFDICVYCGIIKLLYSLYS